MRLVFELTVPMPLSVDEQRVGQRFVVMEVMYRYKNVFFLVLTRCTQGNWRWSGDPVLGEPAIFPPRLS